MILDVLLYEQADHRHRIQQMVVDRLESILCKWRELNPHFERRGGVVVLLGHSLGARTTHAIAKRGIGLG